MLKLPLVSSGPTNEIRGKNKETLIKSLLSVEYLYKAHTKKNERKNSRTNKLSLLIIQLDEKEDHLKTKSIHKITEDINKVKNTRI